MITRMLLNARVVHYNLNPTSKAVEYVDFLLVVIHQLLMEHSKGYAAMHVFREKPDKKKEAQ